MVQIQDSIAQIMHFPLKNLHVDIALHTLMANLICNALQNK